MDCVDGKFLWFLKVCIDLKPQYVDTNWCNTILRSLTSRIVDWKWRPIHRVWRNTSRMFISRAERNVAFFRWFTPRKGHNHLGAETCTRSMLFGENKFLSISQHKEGRLNEESPAKLYAIRARLLQLNAVRRERRRNKPIHKFEQLKENVVPKGKLMYGTRKGEINKDTPVGLTTAGGFLRLQSSSNRPCACVCLYLCSSRAPIIGKSVRQSRVEAKDTYRTEI